MRLANFYVKLYLNLCKEKNQVANIKSQKKRNITNEQKHQANKAKKSRIATTVRAYRALIAKAELEQAEVKLNEIYSLIDRARLDSVYHINTASRKKAALAKLLTEAKQAK